MKTIWILLFLMLQTLLAADLVTKTKTLHAGQSAVFSPKKGETFSITKDLKHLVPDANYDIKMENRGYIYFDNRHQREDMYIIFNETVTRGDKVVVKVNRGYFNYTTQELKALPKSVKKILAASAGKQANAKKHVEKMSDATITTEEYCFDDQGEIVACTSPRATINEKRPQEAVKELNSVEKSIESAARKETEARQGQKEEKRQNIFSAFTQKLKAALSKIRQTLAEKEQERKRKLAAQESQQKSKKASGAMKAAPGNPVSERKRVTKEKPAKKVLQKPSADEINRYANTSWEESKLSRGVLLPHFRALPLHTQKPLFEAYPISEKSSFEKPELRSAKMPAMPSRPFKEEPLSAPALNHLSQSAEAVKDISGKLPANSYQTPQYRKPLASAEKPLPATVKKPAVATVPATAPALPETPLPRKGIPVAAETIKPVVPALPVMKRIQETGRVSAPTIASTSHGTSAQAAAVAPVIPPVTPQPLPVTGSSAPTALPQNGTAPATESQQTYRPPLIVENEKQPLPSEKEPEEKIVITKILKKKQNMQQGEAMVRMQDRVIGGGYNAESSSGKLSVSAYANRRPVSAWVEVYKGKRRVKTFYSGVKREVKLPEGTYILKATYRAGSSKQRKNLGRVRLKNGDAIHKKVYFAIGTLNVVAKRKGKPIYVKVEIYKKGASRRYAYTFSSPGSCIAHLQLAQGHYRIVIKDHGKTQSFDNIYIKGERTKTLQADF